MWFIGSGINGLGHGGSGHGIVGSHGPLHNGNFKGGPVFNSGLHGPDLGLSHHHGLFLDDKHDESSHHEEPIFDYDDHKHYHIEKEAPEVK